MKINLVEEQNIYTKLRDIKAFAFDVDGVLTDGTILVKENGDMLRNMNIKDGYAIQHAIKSGLRIIIITGGNSKGVRIRLEKLGVTEIYDSISDKIKCLNKIVETTGIDYKEIAYMGDDMPDIPVLKKIGFAAAPKDAVNEVLESAIYISPQKGGKGCVRDILEKAMKLKGIWDNKNTHQW